MQHVPFKIKSRYLYLLALLSLFGCLGEPNSPKHEENSFSPQIVRRVPVENARIAQFIAAALGQVGVTTGYDPSYQRLTYPNGDVPQHTGVCSDVLVRAFREIGIDLQKEVHEDMRKNFLQYPQLWHMVRPDPNIDHRRVPNLSRYFQRKGWEVPISSEERHYKPGDIVAWIIPSNLTHIGLVTDRIADGERLMVVHNYGFGTVENDALFLWKQTGHFRMRIE